MTTTNNEFGIDERLLEALKDVREKPMMSYEPIPKLGSGSKVVNFALRGGWPCGKWSLLWGEEGSGKSTLGYLSIAEVMRRNAGASAVIIDTENAIDPIWLDKMGIDKSRCVIYQPETTEAILNTAMDVIKSGVPWFVFLDSLGMMSSVAEQEGEIGDSTVAINARYLATFFSKATRPLAKTSRLDMVTGEKIEVPPPFLMTNHVSEKIGVMYGNPETMPGGRKLRHAISTWVKMYKPTAKEHKMKSDGTLIGVKHRGKVLKYKFGPPMREFEFTVRQDSFSGVDPVGEIADLAFQLNVFSNAAGEPWKTGGLYFGGEQIDVSNVNLPKGVKKDKTKEKLKMLMYQDHDLLFQIESAVDDVISSSVHAKDIELDTEETEDDEELLAEIEDLKVEEEILLPV